MRGVDPAIIKTNLNRILLPTIILLLTTVVVSAQSIQSATASGPEPNSEPRVVQTAPPITNTRTANTPSPQNDAQKRIDRARALAAAHQLQSAAGELEAVRRGASDEVVRNVTSVMLMAIYLEDGNYLRAQSLLDEDFRVRATGGDSALRTYFAVAGQAVNGARAHLSRYRSFGINTSDPTLPPEALSDLDKLRSLLERMAIQAREISIDRNTYDVLALLEDVLGLRLSVARDAEDRAKWELEYTAARQGLASSQTQIASLGSVPALQRSVGEPSTSRGSAAKEPPAEIKEPDGSTGLSTPKETENAPDRLAGRQPEKAGGSSDSNARVISTGVLNARANKRVVPAYPPIAKSSGIEGIVRVYVTLDENGRVAEVTQVEGPILLRKAAEDAARRWRFPPTSVDGKVVRLTGYIEFSFKR